MSIYQMCIQDMQLFFYAILGIQLDGIAREKACLCVSKAITPDIFSHAGHLQDTITFHTAYVFIILFCYI